MYEPLMTHPSGLQVPENLVQGKYAFCNIHSRENRKNGGDPRTQGKVVLDEHYNRLYTRKFDHKKCTDHIDCPLQK